MKKILCLILIVIAAPELFAQNGDTDTTIVVKVNVNKDPRLDILAKAEFEINNMANRFAKGYRLFVLKSNDRDYAMKVRSYLLQNFPEEKVIMTYQSPFIKMKFGDFEDKKDAEKYRDLIMKGKVVTGNVYVVPDTIELKPDKMKQEESQ
jgi:hypothetical protein